MVAYGCRISISVSGLYFFEPSCHLMKKIATLEMNFCMNDGILTEASTHANTQQPLSLGHDIKREH
jgi:hypothetical protein